MNKGDITLTFDPVLPPPLWLESSGKEHVNLLEDVHPGCV